MPTRHADPTGARETGRPPIALFLRNLPDQHREIIVATYFRRRTTHEAAIQLGLAPDTAKARLYHAMRDLSGMIAGSGPRPDAEPGAVGPRPGAEPGAGR